MYRTVTKYEVTKCFYGVAPVLEGPMATTKVRFNSDQRWRGHDLLQYGNVTITPMNRALRVMRFYEARKLTEHWVYRQAQCIAQSLLMTLAGGEEFRRSYLNRSGISK